MEDETIVEFRFEPREVTCIVCGAELEVPSETIGSVICSEACLILWSMDESVSH